MRGCLFTLLLGGVVIALIVVVGLPQVAAGAVTGAVVAAGLEADDTTVTVSSDPPTDLIGLNADRVRIRATDATFRGMRIGGLDLELTDVAIMERTTGGVDGRLTDVTVENVGGRPLTLDAIVLGGGGESLTATTVIESTEAEGLIADAVETRVGVRPSAVTLTAPNRLAIEAGLTIEGTLDVTPEGDLVLLLPDGPLGGGEIVLLQGGEDLPIRLTGLVVTPEGDLRLTGDLSIGILG